MFVGKTEANVKVVIYEKISHQLLLRVGDGELVDLWDGTGVRLWWDIDRYIHHLEIVIPGYEMTATGSNYDLFNEAGLWEPGEHGSWGQMLEAERRKKEQTGG